MGIDHLNVRSSEYGRLRIAELEDAERITTVINSAFRFAEEFFIDVDRIDVAGVLESLNTGKILLAENDGVLLGCVYVEPHPNSQSEIGNPQSSRAYLGLLSVDPARQHSGLGSILMNAAEEYCRGLGIDFMDIKVVNLRSELTAYYGRRGYVETGTSPFPADIETKQPCHFIDMSKPLREDK